MVDLRLVDESAVKPLPEPHPEVDLRATDPTLIGERRFCVAATKVGDRCSAPALKEGWYCSAHAGILDARKGGAARAAKADAVKQEAHALAVEAQLGTRAVVARVLTERHDDVRTVVGAMLDDALDESLAPRERRAMRLALLPYFDQALGKPRESVEVTMPTGTAEVEDLSLAELRSLHAALASEAS